MCESRCGMSRPGPNGTKSAGVARRKERIQSSTTWRKTINNESQICFL